MRNSRYWMGQTNWFIDDTASRENSGADAGHPIPEVERLYRMGTMPYWSASEYHLFYPTDTTSCTIEGLKKDGSTIFVHGSATAGQGQSTLYSGTIDSLLSLSYATNQPWSITSNALSTSTGWTDQGLINKRVRLTSGAASGAKAFTIKDLGSKQARQGEFTSAASYTSPFALTTSSASPASTNTFVVEKLTVLSNVVVNLHGRSQLLFGPSRNFFDVVFESVDVGSNYFFSGSNSNVMLDGSLFRAPNNVTGTFSYFALVASHILNPGAFPRCLRLECYGTTSSAGTTNFLAVSALQVIRHVAQGGRSVFNAIPSNDVAVGIGNLGVFDCSSAGCITVKGDQSVVLLAGATVWGSGNTVQTFDIRPNCSVLYTDATLSKATNFPISTSSAVDVSFGLGHTTCEAFDQSTGRLTAPLNLTWTNILAEIGSGGFCQAGKAGTPEIFSHATGASIMPIHA